MGLGIKDKAVGRGIGGGRTRSRQDLLDLGRLGRLVGVGRRHSATVLRLFVGLFLLNFFLFAEDASADDRCDV